MNPVNTSHNITIPSMSGYQGHHGQQGQQYPLCPNPVISGGVKERIINVEICVKCNNNPCKCNNKVTRNISSRLIRKYQNWKNKCNYKLYRSYRKYLEWRKIANNPNDYTNYYVWKAGNWDRHYHENHFMDDYSAWRRAYDEDDLTSWHDWNEWKDKRKEFKRKNKNYHKIKSQYNIENPDYHKYKNNATLKDYCKLRRFSDWQNFCNQYGYDLNDRSAYKDWFKVHNKDYNSRKQYLNEFNNWKSSDDQMAYQNWMNWCVWKKRPLKNGKDKSSQSSCPSSESSQSSVSFKIPKSVNSCSNEENQSKGNRRVYGQYRKKPQNEYRRHKNY